MPASPHSLLSALPHPELPHATRLFLAVVLALGAAELAGFHNPYWAAMPVFVISQPRREDMALRGLLRILGTLVGGAIGLAALTWLAGSPALIALVVAATVALGIAIAYRIGTTYNYGFMIMGLTIGVIVLPSLGLGADGLTLAIERLWCTLFGIVSITAISWFFTPARGGPVPPRAHPHCTRQMVLRGAIAALLSGLATYATAVAPIFPVMTSSLAVVVFACVLGQMHDPRPVIRAFLPGVALGVTAAILYRALAEAMGPAPLPLFALAVAFIAAGALLRAHPRTANLGLDTNMCFLLAAEIGAVGHPLGVTSLGGLTMICGAILVASVLYQIARVPHRVTAPRPTA